MSRGPDAGAQLERQLLRQAAAAGVEAILVTAAWDRWASATFAGARHTLHLSAAPGPHFEQWVAGLDEAEVPLNGHLLADMHVETRQRVGDRVEIHLAALTVQVD